MGVFFLPFIFLCSLLLLKLMCPYHLTARQVSSADLTGLSSFWQCNLSCFTPERKYYWPSYWVQFFLSRNLDLYIYILTCQCLASIIYCIIYHIVYHAHHLSVVYKYANNSTARSAKNALQSVEISRLSRCREKA